MLYSNCCWLRFVKYILLSDILFNELYSLLRMINEVSVYRSTKVSTLRLSIYLFVCYIATSYFLNYWSNLHVFWINEEPIKFWKASASGCGFRTSLKDSSTLSDRIFFSQFDSYPWVTWSKTNSGDRAWQSPSQRHGTDYQRQSGHLTLFRISRTNWKLTSSDGPFRFLFDLSRARAPLNLTPCYGA